jgi:PAS domain S-box-containing protein
VGTTGQTEKALLYQIEKDTDDLLTLVSAPGANARDVGFRFKLRRQELHLNGLLQELANWSLYLQPEIAGLDPISRNWLMTLVCAGSVMNALLLLFVGRLFLRDIIGRLSIMVDNSVRLKGGRRLQPRLPGSDEIARLDAAFHEMAAALNESLERQQALIHNARELVCSLDEQMKFVLVSDSALSVLGYAPEKLIGKHISTVVLPGDRNKLLNAIGTARDGDSLIPLEARVFRADDTTLETRWSIKFSQKDSAMYCVVHDVSETKAVERLRREVLQMISHDLRSPLAAIHGFHSLLLSGTVAELNEQGLRLANISGANGNRMLELINDLLDIEKMESGMLKLDRNNINLADVVRQAIESVQLLADAKHIKLDADRESIFVFADQKRIVQVLVNLLSNAIKFSGEHTSVRTEIRRQDDAVEVRVIDQGPGIPADSLGAVFDRFKQLESGHQAKKTGSGLGLAICRALVELHGGQIGVTSAMGEGATFYFRLGVRDGLTIR